MVIIIYLSLSDVFSMCLSFVLGIVIKKNPLNFIDFFLSGSFATATCQVCGYKVDAEAIKGDIFAQRIPQCPKCTENEETTQGSRIAGDEQKIEDAVSRQTETNGLDFMQQRQTGEI